MPSRLSLHSQILTWSLGAMVVVGGLLIVLWGADTGLSSVVKIGLSIAGALASGATLSARIERVIEATHGDLVARAGTMLERLSPQPNQRTESPRALASALDGLTLHLSHELAQLEDERDWLEGILENGMEGVLVTDASGRIILANRALRAMVRTHGEIEGKLPIEAIRSDDLGLLLRKVQTEGKPSIGELDLGALDARHVRVHAAPLQPSRGVVAMLYDVTDLRRLETMRRDFVANVSHELRTPIAAIRAGVETLEDGAMDDPAVAADFLGIISRHAERLHALVEDLLDLSKLDARRHEIEMRTLNIHDALVSAIELFSHAAGRKGVALSLGEASPDLFASADARAVDRILANFIDNAIKYCSEGDSITLSASPLASLSTTAPTMGSTTGSATPPMGVRLSVRDTGPGIEGNHLPRLFERFYRAQKGRSRDSGGTGLGLAIAKHLAEAMGGSVQVESEIGKGSVFSIELRPVVDAKLAQGGLASTGLTDAGLVDAGLVNAGLVNTGLTDAGTTDPTTPRPSGVVEAA